MKSINIEGTVRSKAGKKESEQLRKSGRIPCSIYGGEANVSFSAPVSAFKDLVYTPEFYTAQVTVEGKTHHCVMQDIQFHPVSDAILHIDFRELHPEKRIVLELPVKLEGTAAGVREGGRVNLRMKKLKARLLPKDLVEHISIRITDLTLGKSVKVSELNFEGIEFLNPPHMPIVSVQVPRVVKEETPVAATPAAVAAAPAAGAPPAAEKGAEKKEEKKK